MSKSQSVRFHQTTVHIQTVVLNGITCLRLQDVKQRFPSVSVLCIDNVQLLFLCDENGNDLIPLRIEACPDKVIEAFEPIGLTNSTLYGRLDRISADMEDIKRTNELILANTQETLNRLKHVMTQMYELQEYTTPRYFFILPAKHHDLAFINNIKNWFLLHFKLYFLCECSDEPDQLHVAPHDGYSIKEPTEFLTKYGPYLRTTLNVAQVVFTIGSCVVPQLGHVSTAAADTLIPIFHKLGDPKMTDKLNLVEKMLGKAEHKMTNIDPSGSATKESLRAPLQGPQLRELESYLEVIDNTNSLGNLYRTVTDEGHVRWVCLQHYNSIAFNRNISEYIRQLEAFRGQFNKETNEAFVTKITLTTKNVEMLCDALTKGFNILSLTFVKCTFNDSDLDKLFDIVINRSSIRCLNMSNINIHAQQWLGISRDYSCGYMSVLIKNQSLEIRVSKRFQVGDMKILTQIWLQNKACQTFYLSGCDFQGFGKDFQSCVRANQQLSTLIVENLNDIEFLCDILNTKSVLKHLKFTFRSSTPSTLSRFCEVLENNSTLVELSIIDHRYSNDEDFIIKLLNTLDGHKSLKHLTFHVYNMKPSDRKEKCLVKMLNHNSFISRLYISESIISNKFVEALIRASQKINSLTHLEFYDCQINENDISSLKLLQTAEGLTNLIFSEEPYWAVTVNEMRRQFQDGNQYQYKKLEQYIKQQQKDDTIDLKEWKLTNRDIWIIIKEAIINKQCTQLWLNSNKITFIGASILADALNDNKTLQWINLDNNQLGDRGIYFLVKMLLNNTVLHTLHLRNTGITDRSVKYLVEMIKTNKTLIVVKIGMNQISDDGIMLLVNAIKNDNTTIRWLDLSENNLLTDLSVDYLLQMIKYNHSLKMLTINGCNLSSKGKSKLKLAQQSKNLFIVDV